MRILLLVLACVSAFTCGYYYRAQYKRAHRKLTVIDILSRVRVFEKGNQSEQ